MTGLRVRCRSALACTALALTAAVVVVAPSALGAQQATVTATVRTRAGRPVDLASVELFVASRDTTAPAAETATDSSGAFSLSAPAGAYLLRISFLSFKPYRRSLRLSPGEQRALGTIVLAEDTLSLPGVTVSAERSQMSLSFEKRVFRVGKDITVTGGSVLDVLNNVPSLMTDFKGTVSLRGSSGVRILIDGKPSAIYRNGSKALQSLSADMIEEVQVITNPSARYSAEGSAGIINIVLKKKRERGFNGTLGFMQRSPESTQWSADMNLRRGSVNWFLNGAVAYAADPSHSRTYQHYQTPDTAYLYHAFDNGNETDWHGDFTLGADLHMASRQTLTLSGLIHFEDKEDRWRGGYVDSTLTGSFLDHIDRADTIGGGEGGEGLTLDYEKLLGGAEGHKLSASADYEHALHQELPRIVEASRQPPFDTIYHAVDDIRRSDALRLRADWARPLPDSGKVEAGMRGDFGWQDNHYTTRERPAEGAWTPLPAFNSNYAVADHVAAAYATLSSRFGPFSYQVGVRGEQYRVRTTLRATSEQTAQTYADLFPSVFLTYHLTSRRSVQASYSRRISRPDPSLLLARTDYSDSRSQFVGNPDLRPEYGDSYEIDLLQSWQTGSLLASVYDRRGTGVIQRVQTLDAGGILRTTPINLSTSEDRGLELAVEEGFTDDLKLSASANLFRTHAHGAYAGTTYGADTNRFTSRVQLQWSVADGLRLQTSVRYYGPAKTIQGRRESMTYVNTALAKDFLEGRATLSINSEDLFNTRRERFTLTDPAYFSRQQYWEPSGLRIEFTYRIHPEKDEG